MVYHHDGAHRASVLTLLAPRAGFGINNRREIGGVDHRANSHDGSHGLDPVENPATAGTAVAHKLNVIDKIIYIEHQSCLVACFQDVFTLFFCNRFGKITVHKKIGCFSKAKA
jgi:hypothetical protein